ncbi:MAG: hypothetical protein OIN87_11995 [Candidatus Methanoperedens sp.]|nr:hypothetical protein [Candidatus Methanoperedens sp.]
MDGEQMGIQEDIFNEFFRKLESDEKFPDLIVKELKTLWESGEISSKEKLLEVIKIGCEDAKKD